MLDKIRATVDTSISFEKSFEAISKNPGVTLLSLDPTETSLQLFHHPSIVGGSWAHPVMKLVAISGFDSDTKPIQLISKSIKDFELKSFSTEEFADGMVDSDSFKNL